MFKAADAARAKPKSTLTVAHNFDKDITDFHNGAPTARLYFRMLLEYRWKSTSSIYKELLLIIVPLNAHLYIIKYLFDFVKTWPQ